MKQSFSHHLSQEQAREVARQAIAGYLTKLADYSPKFTWHDDDKGELSFRALGKTVSGLIALQPGQIIVDLDVPLRLVPFRKKAMDVIGAEIQRWVAQAG